MQTEPNDMLSDIESFTMATIAPYMAISFDRSVQCGYKEFEGPDRNTTYLMFYHKDRVLFYGVDIPKKRFIFPMLSTETDWDVLQKLFSPCLFARKGTLSEVELENLYYSSDDDDIEELEVVEPAEGEGDKDFFLRNAMWLLNPMVH